MKLKLSEIKKEYFGLIWKIKSDLLRKEKQVPQFFPLFVKKARESLDAKLEKFVGTKTHLAVTLL